MGKTGEGKNVWPSCKLTRKKIPSTQSMKNIRNARESTGHEKAWMSRASRFLAPHTFSLHTLFFLTISRTPRFLEPHFFPRLEALSRGTTVAQGWNHAKFLLFQHQE